MQYPSEGPTFGWCIRCRKVKPTWGGWEWTDIFWMEYPGGISSASSFVTDRGGESDGFDGDGSDGGGDSGAGDGGDGGGD
jgi:hypothetical protein